MTLTSRKFPHELAKASTNSINDLQVPISDSDSNSDTEVDDFVKNQEKPTNQEESKENSCDDTTFGEDSDVLDTSERDRALSDLTTERKLRRRAEAECAEYKAKYQLLESEFTQIREELNCIRSVSQAFGQTISGGKLTQSLSRLDSTDSMAYSGRYELINSINISNTGNCRVMASCDYLNIMCVSQPSTNPIFRGYGVRKINTIDHRPLKYIHLHTQALRDLAFHPDAQDGMLLSVSLDKSVRLTSLLTDQVVQTYQCPSPVWSCCWAAPSPHNFFAGCSNGSIFMFDIRITSGPLITLSVPDNSSPVIGLQYVPSSTERSLCSTGGILVGQLTKITFMAESSTRNSALPHPILTEGPNETTSTGSNDRANSPDLFSAPIEPPVVQVLNSCSQYHPYSLPLEGSLTSLSLVPETGHFLASYRPSQRLPRVRHVLAELQYDRANHTDDDDTIEQTIGFTSLESHSLWAGSRMKMLTRAKLFRIDNGSEMNMLAVAGSEDAGGALVWRCDTGARLQTLKPPDTSPDCPVIDVCSYTTASTAGSSKPHLALLTERALHLYRWHTSIA